ncbi:pentapeptide repeat-containing protein [Flavobacterium rakeshii]|uniref:pentapeptide repeat-containing protein n=1 Tax=Flavobacterium rakeshii TaxID=1038845 RepID=UPI002E7B1F85|nr:pentapeptide repeat-containing protein [Flavobacterium rakeshii]MEE1898445.1 pentapeptide repeat-containing protein [Flavobacterium rakeshii]
MSANYILDTQINNTVFGPDDIMYKDYERCTFTDCDFTQCNYLGVAFTDCEFINCNFAEAKINYVSFRDVMFTGCNFTGVNFAMVDDLLFKFEFKECILDYTKFYTLKMRGTVFTGCQIIASDFMNADITDVIFDNCNLHKSVFLDTIANKVDFSTSYNYTIDPEKNKLKKAIFSESGLKGLLTKHEIIIR